MITETEEKLNKALAKAIDMALDLKWCSVMKGLNEAGKYYLNLYL